MISIKDIPSQKLIENLKEELKKIEQIKPPAWVKFVKSGVHRERPPEQEDFWFIRTASVMRRIYLNQVVGVQRLRSYYGGGREFGTAPAHFRKSSGNILRKILQQLEKAEFVEKGKKGRVLTKKGRSFVDKIAKKAAE